MARPALAAALLVLCSGACSTEQHTTYVDPPVGAVSAVEGATPAQLMAESQAACDSYGLMRRTASYGRCVQDEFATRRPG